MSFKVTFNESNRPSEGGDFTKLDTNRDYVIRITGYESKNDNGEFIHRTSKQDIPEIWWITEVLVDEANDRWRKLSRNALRTQVEGGGIKMLRRLSDAILLIPMNESKDGEQELEEDDFVGTHFLARIKYEGEYPRVSFVKRLGEETSGEDLPF